MFENTYADGSPAYRPKHEYAFPGNSQKSFLTGSRAYGTPRPDSDIDLAILLDDDGPVPAFGKLAEYSDGDGVDPDYGDMRSDFLRFGNLNLICFFDDEVFGAWRRATDDLQNMRPATREQAIARIKQELKILEGAQVTKRCGSGREYAYIYNDYDNSIHDEYMEAV
jgi:hypothetical protein